MADTSSPPGLRGPALDELRDRFMEHCPDFRSFVEPGTGWAQEEKGYKADAMERVRSTLGEDRSDAELGREVWRILEGARWTFVNWRTVNSLKEAGETLLEEFYSVIGRLVRSKEPVESALTAAFDALEGLRARGASTLTYGARINTVYCALAMARPNEVAPLQIRRINKAWVSLTGGNLFVAKSADTVADYRRFNEAFSELFEIMRDDWGWEPQDWLDIQGFLYIATDTSGAGEDDAEPEAGEPVEAPAPARHPEPPENLILYGPPGTGKTYKSMEEALRLCGGPVASGTREEMTEAYRRLLGEGRIEFVTFHQSMAYEDFVEGRQPVTDPDETGEASSAGFRLETVPGIFRRIARRAESSGGRPADGDGIGVGKRRVFKMSIGANNPKDAHLFKDAIRGGYTIIGFEDIDWSDAKYTDRDAIIEAYQARGEHYNNRHSQIQVPFTLRNEMREDDIVVVSKGNSLFRAIGVVTGGYEYHPRPEGTYNHRRAMNWLWVDHDGAPVSEIYSQQFTQRSIYMLDRGELKLPALERYMNSQRPGTGSPEPFVLIIDEINRANISKVFGELITLLEPDKRLGQPNELRVRLPYSGDGFGVPSNLHILGTMNTADRSIALLDTALRRRFTFREMMPDTSVLDEVDGIDLPRLLSTLNERIEYLYDREHQIGHAYFMGCETRADVDGVMRHKVIPLLAEYFYDDWDKIAAVLGDQDATEARDGEATGGFLMRSEIKAPPGQDNGEADRRYRWEVRPEAFDYGRVLGE